MTPRRGIRLRRAYQPAEPGGGKRFLVERLWPRGVRKEDLPLDGWLKELAPSPALRTWFAHDPAKWAEFKRRYAAELRGNEEALAPLRVAARKGTVTLVYAARDTERNSAVLLREYLLRGQ